MAIRCVRSRTLLVGSGDLSSDNVRQQPPFEGGVIGVSVPTRNRSGGQRHWILEIYFIDRVRTNWRILRRAACDLMEGFTRWTTACISVPAMFGPDPLYGQL